MIRATTSWRARRICARCTTATVRPASLRPTMRAPDATRSEEHTSELQSLMRISYAVFCLKKKKTVIANRQNIHLQKRDLMKHDYISRTNRKNQSKKSTHKKPYNRQ